MERVAIEQFVKLANFFFFTVGIEPYDKGIGIDNSLRKNLIFYCTMTNLVIAVIFEIGYVVEALINGSNFEEATMTLAYIGFVFVGITKMLYIWTKRKVLTFFMKELVAVFPKTLPQQLEYLLSQYLKQCTRITIGFSALYMIHIWTYNLYAIFDFLISDLWLQMRTVGLELPYHMWIPWNYRDNWSYYVLYVLHCIAAYTCSAGQMASDLLLFSTASQVIMHYDYVSRSIENYIIKYSESASENDKKDDMDFISHMVAYHDKVLGLSDLMNEVFGVPLLLNFLTSSFVICFLGFQMTIGLTSDILIKLVLFLITSMAQVFWISYFGQALIDASENIADAVYNQDWSNAEIRYKKMLILIAERAQKPALLKATTFLDVSRGTMTDIMQMSYKFFALLRTIYSD